MQQPPRAVRAIQRIGEIGQPKGTQRAVNSLRRIMIVVLPVSLAPHPLVMMIEQMV